MNRTKWTFWFLLSVLWLMMLFFLAIINDPIIKSDFYVITIAVCLINLVGCVVIGIYQEDLED